MRLLLKAAWLVGYLDLEAMTACVVGLVEGESEARLRIFGVLTLVLLFVMWCLVSIVDV